jgi:hypothetical protein
VGHDSEDDGVAHRLDDEALLLEDLRISHDKDEG